MSIALLAQSHYLKLFNERQAWHQREMEMIKAGMAGLSPAGWQTAVAAYNQHLGAVIELNKLKAGHAAPALSVATAPTQVGSNPGGTQTTGAALDAAAA